MAMRSSGPPAPLAGSVTRLAKPQHRQTQLAVLGVLVVAACALGAVLLSRSSARRVDVLVAARDLQPGSPIAAGDLRIARVSADTNARFVAATNASALIGRVPRGFVPSGTALNVGMVAPTPQVPAGDSVVGAVLDPGAVPVALVTGETVEVLVTVAPNSPTTPGASDSTTPTEAGTAVVFSVTSMSVGPQAKVWVSLLAPNQLSATIAQAAQDGQLRLAVVPAATP